MAVVEWSRNGQVGLIELNRPEVLNAVNGQMVQELLAVLADAAADADVGVIVLTGRGRAFCAGVDLKELPDAEAVHRRVLEIQDLSRRLLSLNRPVIAALNGPAVGMGLELALLCDLRIAAKSARLGFPEVSIGVTVTNGASVSLPALVGQARARELLFTAELVSATRAEAIGLVNRVVDDEQVLDVAFEMAHQILKHSPRAVQETRRLLDAAVWDGIEVALYREIEALLRCVAPQLEPDNSSKV